MAGKFSKAITPDQVAEWMKQGVALHIVDVREQDEWDSGHIAGAKHMPLGMVSQRHSELNPKQETIIVCRSGNRSGLACEHLESLGYNVVNMTGGMMNWNGSVEC
ncbi:rhodanese-like domain-containing protein [Paenibacillus sp. MMS18-CY102]|uniref:rhodanese-like domain-containing protein n=1 Tax=Paenibacillus sp. MMS18-CY102 TaxID=2682849 RepID=UPI00136607AD|nr:rhodanese-like domain-containing protein [Paenibacillus sp. MMS18-CY102]MWC30787.1 rhodanese-like domain-containing protein [Paenibacillus sp. MMS18-CY102]